MWGRKGSRQTAPSMYQLGEYVKQSEKLYYCIKSMLLLGISLDETHTSECNRCQYQCEKE